MTLGAAYYPEVRREAALVSYWRLNDPSGNTQAIDYGARYGLNGIYNGSPARGPSLIQVDLSAASYQFGTGKSVSIGDGAPLRLTGDLSIEAWVAPYAASQTAVIAAKMNSGASVAQPWYLGLLSGDVQFALGNGTTQVSVASSSQLPVSIPSHVVATSFRGVMTIYVNGASVATGTLGAQAVTDSRQAVYVGALSTGSGTLNGLIAEVAVYSGALSARRVARHFTIGQQVLSDPAHYTTIDPPSYN